MRKCRISIKFATRRRPFSYSLPRLLRLLRLRKLQRARPVSGGQSLWRRHAGRFLIPFPIFIGIVFISGITSPTHAQNKEVLQSVDSLKTTTTVIDTTEKGKITKKTRVYNPRKAALRSAILPGWGQFYNRKYWKLPIVYGALGISGGVFVYNLQTYRDTRFAYRVKYNMRVLRTDSLLFSQIKPELQGIAEESLRAYRDRFRRDIDYSALFFVILWGLNVVDASVDAHLKAFDVSEDLSLQFRPGHSEMADTNGFSLVLHIGKKKQASFVRSLF
jgi:Family of unknown function (DUF5683)